MRGIPDSCEQDSVIRIQGFIEEIGYSSMLNIEGKSSETKTGKNLILVSVMPGVLLILLLVALIMLIHPAGDNA